MNIADFIAAEALKPFRWGDTDCISTANRWVLHVTGLSPLGWVGHDYSTEFEAMQILEGRGGLALLVNRSMRAVGIHKTNEPQSGDVGLIMHHRKLCMAIHAGEFWFSHNQNGLIGAPINSVWKAWSIQCR